MRELAYMGWPSPMQVNCEGWCSVQSPGTLVRIKFWVPTATKVATAPLRLDSRPQGYRP